MFRCQERNSGRDWGTAAGNIPFRSLVSPLALVQESINVLGKCAVQVSVLVVENHSDSYPENIFRIWNTLLLVQSTFDIRIYGRYGWMIAIFTVDCLKFEAENRNSSVLMNALIIV